MNLYQEHPVIHHCLAAQARHDEDDDDSKEPSVCGPIRRYIREILAAVRDEGSTTYAGLRKGEMWVHPPSTAKMQAFSPYPFN